MGEHTLSLTHEAPTGLGDAVPGGNRSVGEQAAVAEEMLADGVEAAVLLPKRGDEVLLEEVGAGGEGDGVRDGAAEAVGVGFDEVDGFEDGCGGRGVEEGDERFDGCDGFGEV